MNQYLSVSALVLLGCLGFGSTPAAAAYGDYEQVVAAIKELNATAARAAVPEGEATAGRIALAYAVAVRTDPQPTGTHIGDLAPNTVVSVRQTMVVAGVTWYLVAWQEGGVAWPRGANTAVIYGVTPKAGWIRGTALTVTQVQGARQAVVYDVYYLDANSRWVWYVAYTHGPDVDAAMASLHKQGFQATWQQRN